MNLIALTLLPSVISLCILPCISNRKLAGIISAIACTFGFIFAALLVMHVYRDQTPVFFFQHWLICDKFGGFFVLINSLIGMTTSFYAINYLNNENSQHLHPLVYRFYHTGYQLFLLGMLIVLLSNNIGIMWIAMELATIASVALVGLYHTKEALEAAWKYLILCGVGIGLALLGTVILYFSAHTQNLGEHGLLWTQLIVSASQLPPRLLAISFILLFVGYGTKVGFVPLHNWLPDAHTEAPAPISALLSGLLLNVALFAILRFKWILSGTSLHNLPSYLLLIFGFIGLLFSAFSLFHQRHLKRLFAYSSIEHLSLVSIAFGLGSPLALLVAMLHMAMHSLSKTAVFFSCGTIIQQYGTQKLSKLKGILKENPTSASLLLVGTFIILGLPPSGLFISELLLILATLQTHSLLSIPLVIGLGLSFLAILLKIQPLFWNQPRNITHMPIKNKILCFSPTTVHLSLVIISGLIIPFWLLNPVVHAIAGRLS